MRRANGFTLIELVTVIVLLGILAGVALPRLSTTTYHEAVFHDRVLAALRYAQKTAVSHRRPICVTFASDPHSLALNMNTALSERCDTLVLIPGTNSNQISSTQASAQFSPLPTAFSFAASGTTTDQTITFLSGSRITIIGATGYVF